MYKVILIANQAAHFAEQVEPHQGHELQISTYGNKDDIWNVAIECVTCGMVLIDADLSLEDSD